MAAESVQAFPYGSSAASAFSINIPSSLGYVSETYSAHAGATSPDVILIQNLHINRSVQFAVSGILKRLKKQGLMPDSIAVEGATGPLHIGFMQRYPDPSIRKAAADYLVQQGEMPGVMHFAVTEGEGNLFGIETEEYYQANLEMFRQSYKERAALRQEIEKIQAVLPKLKKDPTSRENAAILEKDVDAVSQLINNQVIPDELPATLRQATEAVDHLKLVLPQDTADQLVEPLSASVNFYALALLRNDELFKNALALRELGHQKTSIVVTGGFHTAALAEACKQHGLSYAVITPDIKRADKVDENLYVERLLDHHLTPRQIEGGLDWASMGVMAGPVADTQLEAANFVGNLAAGAWDAATRMIGRFSLPRPPRKSFVPITATMVVAAVVAVFGMGAGTPAQMASRTDQLLPLQSPSSQTAQPKSQTAPNAEQNPGNEQPKPLDVTIINDGGAKLKVESTVTPVPRSGGETQQELPRLQVTIIPKDPKALVDLYLNSDTPDGIKGEILFRLFVADDLKPAYSNADFMAMLKRDADNAANPDVRHDAQLVLYRARAKQTKAFDMMLFYGLAGVIAGLFGIAALLGRLRSNRARMVLVFLVLGGAGVHPTRMEAQTLVNYLNASPRGIQQLRVAKPAQVRALYFESQQAGGLPQAPQTNPPETTRPALGNVTATASRSFDRGEKEGSLYVYKTSLSPNEIPNGYAGTLPKRLEILVSPESGIQTFEIELAIPGRAVQTIRGTIGEDRVIKISGQPGPFFMNGMHIPPRDLPQLHVVFDVEKSIAAAVVPGAEMHLKIDKPAAVTLNVTSEPSQARGAEAQGVSATPTQVLAQTYTKADRIDPRPGLVDDPYFEGYRLHFPGRFDVPTLAGLRFVFPDGWADTPVNIHFVSPVHVSGDTPNQGEIVDPDGVARLRLDPFMLSSLYDSGELQHVTDIVLIVHGKRLPDTVRLEAVPLSRQGANAQPGQITVPQQPLIPQTPLTQQIPAVTPVSPSQSEPPGASVPIVSEASRVVDLTVGSLPSDFLTSRRYGILELRITPADNTRPLTTRIEVMTPNGKQGLLLSLASSNARSGATMMEQALPFDGIRNIPSIQSIVRSYRDGNDAVIELHPRSSDDLPTTIHIEGDENLNATIKPTWLLPNRQAARPVTMPSPQEMRDAERTVAAAQRRMNAARGDVKRPATAEFNRAQTRYTRLQNEVAAAQAAMRAEAVNPTPVSNEGQAPESSVGATAESQPEAEAQPSTPQTKSSIWRRAMLAASAFILMVGGMTLLPSREAGAAELPKMAETVSQVSAPVTQVIAPVNHASVFAPLANFANTAMNSVASVANWMAAQAHAIAAKAQTVVHLQPILAHNNFQPQHFAAAALVAVATVASYHILDRIVRRRTENRVGLLGAVAEAAAA